MSAGAVVLLEVTPVGWVIMIAAATTAGFFAAKRMDEFGKELAGYIYDRKGPLEAL